MVLINPVKNYSIEQYISTDKNGNFKFESTEVNNNSSYIYVNVFTDENSSYFDKVDLVKTS